MPLPVRPEESCQHGQTCLLYTSIAPLKGHEFYRQAKALNGTIIRIVPGSPDCINVMEIRKIDHTSSELLDGPMPEQSELAAKIQKLHIFFSLLIPDLSNEERQLLDEAIVTTYRNKGITYSNASLDDPCLLYTSLVPVRKGQPG